MAPRLSISAIASRRAVLAGAWSWLGVAGMAQAAARARDDLLIPVTDAGAGPWAGPAIRANAARAEALVGVPAAAIKRLRPVIVDRAYLARGVGPHGDPAPGETLALGAARGLRITFFADAETRLVPTAITGGLNGALIINGHFAGGGDGDGASLVVTAAVIVIEAHWRGRYFRVAPGKRDATASIVAELDAGVLSPGGGPTP